MNSRAGGPCGALLLPLAVCAAFGLVQGRIIARPGMAQVIVTLAGMLFILLTIGALPGVMTA